MSRIVYQDGKLFLSLTREEVKEASDNIGRPIELDVGQLKVFQEDIHKAAMAHWSKVEIHREIRAHQKYLKSTSKKKK
ncbi:MAG TPA: hypothetical protein VLB82_01875 [Thermodesulfobacteriota bacterium]|jgi:hypothetical protein|nr:hypothetical protein [Thermodesulfobacteriota bacterium]